MTQLYFNSIVLQVVCLFISMAGALAADPLADESDSNTKSQPHSLKVKGIGLDGGPFPCAPESLTYYAHDENRGKTEEKLPAFEQLECTVLTEEDSITIIFTPDGERAVRIVRKQYFEPTETLGVEDFFDAIVRFYGTPTYQSQISQRAIYGDAFRDTSSDSLQNTGVGLHVGVEQCLQSAIRSAIEAYERGEMTKADSVRLIELQVTLREECDQDVAYFAKYDLVDAAAFFDMRNAQKALMEPERQRLLKEVEERRAAELNRFNF